MVLSMGPTDVSMEPADLPPVDSVLLLGRGTMIDTAFLAFAGAHPLIGRNLHRG
jgi:hypothetical protein